MKIFWTILKFVIIWAVIAALVIMGAIMLFNSLELGLKVLAGLFIIWLVFYIIYRLIKRYQAKKRVERLVNFERGEAGSEEQQGELWFFKEFFQQDKQLVKRFNRIFKYLNVSKLGFMGSSAIYTKPWYLVMGEVSSKKERIFDSSDIVYPITNVKDLKSEAGDVDFYLTNDAIYVNTSGFLYPGSGEKIPMKLAQLLRTLAFQRPKEPINGIVLAVDVMDFITGTDDTIKDLANKQRFYLAFFMAYLRVQLPVYLVLTNCEKLLGTDFYNLLKDKQLEESLGEYNQDGLEVDEFIGQSIDVIRFRVESIINLYMSSGNKIEPELLQTLSKIPSIENRLKLYAKILFTPNEYQEAAFLFGFYFAGNKDQKCVNVRELMEEIIPNDRGRVHMLERFRRRTMSYSTYFLVGWISVSALFVFLVWKTAFSNIDTITSIETEYKQKVIRKEILDYNSDLKATDDANLLESLNISEGFLEMSKNIYTMSYLRDIAHTVDEEEQSWILPWKAVSGVENVGTTLKYNLYLMTKKHIVDGLDGVLSKNFANGFSPLNRMRMEQNEVDKLIADFAGVLYYRIDLLNKVLSDAPAEQIKGSTPFVMHDLYFADLDVTEVDIEILNSTYIDALLWHREGDRKAIEKELSDLTELLDLVIQQGSGDLQWIIGWANRSLISETVNVDDFFLGSGRSEPPLEVGAAFTALGNTIIDDFIVKMFNIFSSDSDFYKKLSDFRISYVSQYTNNWAIFLNDSYRGTHRLRNRDEWYNALQQMTSDGNPYFRMLNRMISEMAPLLESELLENSGIFLKEKEKQKIDQVISELNIEQNKNARPKTEAEIEAEEEKKKAAEEKKKAEAELNGETEEAEAEAEEEINILQTPPEWVALAQYYQEAKQFSDGASNASGGSGGMNKALSKTALKVVGKAGKAGKQLAKMAKKAKKIKKALGKSKTAKSAEELESNMEKVAKELDNFFVNITNIALEGNSKQFLYKEIQTAFNTGTGAVAQPPAAGGAPAPAASAAPAEGSGSLSNVKKSLKTLQNLMGIQNRQNEPFWMVFNNTIRTVQEYMAVEASLEVQTLWDKNFLTQVQGLSEAKLIDFVYNTTSGALWAFSKENVDPFVEFTPSGALVLKEVNGSVVRFNKEFLEFYYNGQQGLRNSQSFYPVFFESGPTSVNSEALFKPVKTILSLTCGDTTYLSINLNFYSKDLFEWRPGCGDLVVTIDFSVFTVSRTFPAPQGFPNFVREFKGGTYRLTPDDFPDSAINLKDINVREINLRYNVIGLQELLKGVDSFPTSIPTKIVEGWDYYQ